MGAFSRVCYPCSKPIVGAREPTRWYFRAAYVLKGIARHWQLIGRIQGAGATEDEPKMII